MFARIFSALAVLTLFPSLASAELAWKHFVQEFQCTPEQKSQEARFPFKNTGTTPVTIKDLKTSCGCTTAKLDKRTYAPGETGEIVATYSFRGQTGALRKTVLVTTDDKPQPVLLDIRVFRHEPFELKPSLVYWRAGDPGEAKAVQLRANGYPVHIKSVTSSDPNLTTAVQTVKEGDEYTVTVKPGSTVQKGSAEITVLTDFPAAAPRSYKIQARIK